MTYTRAAPCSPRSPSASSRCWSSWASTRSRSRSTSTPPRAPRAASCSCRGCARCSSTSGCSWRRSRWPRASSRPCSRGWGSASAASPGARASPAASTGAPSTSCSRARWTARRRLGQGVAIVFLDIDHFKAHQRPLRPRDGRPRAAAALRAAARHHPGDRPPLPLGRGGVRDPAAAHGAGGGARPSASASAPRWPSGPSRPARRTPTVAVTVSLGVAGTVRLADRPRRAPRPRRRRLLPGQGGRPQPGEHRSAASGIHPLSPPMHSQTLHFLSPFRFRSSRSFFPSSAPSPTATGTSRATRSGLLKAT